MLSALCKHPPGAFENPLSRARVEQKFRLFGASTLAGEQIEFIDAVNRLETFGSARELLALLRAPSRAGATAAAE